MENIEIRWCKHKYISVENGENVIRFKTTLQYRNTGKCPTHGHAKSTWKDVPKVELDD